MTGHSAHDDGRYVPKELFEEWGTKDPILRWETRLIRDKVMSERDVREMATRITQEVDQAVSLAESDPLPDPEETLEGVYADQSVDAPLAFAASFFSPDRWR